MFKKDSGCVVLIDIDGYTKMKLEEEEDRYLSVLEDFFLACENRISEMRKLDGGGYIIGDGALFFLKTADTNALKNILMREFVEYLKDVFHQSVQKNKLKGNYQLSFAAGLCNYHIRRENDLVGPEVDKLFGLIYRAEDETLHLNDKLAEAFETLLS